jgi:hypothetical protein
MEDTKLITFFDTVGRTLIAEFVSDTETHVTVKNPVIVHIVPNQESGQMALQLLPAFFKEFLADKSQDTEWTYFKNNITLSNNPELDFRLKTQYQNMFSEIQVPDNNIITPQQAANPTEQTGEVVNLFDESK